MQQRFDLHASAFRGTAASIWLHFNFLLVGRNQRRQLCTDTASSSSSSSFMLQCKPAPPPAVSAVWGDPAVHTHPHRQTDTLQARSVHAVLFEMGLRSQVYKLSVLLTHTAGLMWLSCVLKAQDICHLYLSNNTLNVSDNSICDVHTAVC